MGASQQVADRVLETSTTTGTGSFALAGAVTGYRTFNSAFFNGATVYYYAEDGINWESGLATFTSPSTLARTTVAASSNANAAVNFPAGTKRIACAVTQAAIASADGDVSGPGAAVVNGSLALWSSTTGKAIGQLAGSGFIQLASGVASVLSAAATKTALSLVKADVGLGNVDNLSAASILANSALTGVPTAPTAAGGTNTTQVATTAFVTAAVSTAVTGLLDLKNTLDCSANPNYPGSSLKGDTYFVSVAGKIGGASGKSVDVGDAIIAILDNAGGTEASVGTSWVVLEHNLTGALLAANNLSDLTNTATAWTNLSADAKVRAVALTGFSSSTGAVTSADSVLSALGKLEGTKAPLASPSFSGVITFPGAMVVVGTAMTTAIDFSKGQNDLTLSSAPTLTVSGSPVTGQQTTIHYIGDTVDRVVTLPVSGTWRSVYLNANITTFTVPANTRGYINLICTGSNLYDIINEPESIQDRSWNRTQTTGANETKTLVAYASQAGTIKAIYGKTTAGTIAVQVRINGTNVTGGTCTAATTRASGTATAARTFAVGDVIDIVYSSNSSAANTDVTVVWTPGAL